MSELVSLFDPKLIEKKNAAFHRMSTKRQRVAIAKDVLQQIKLNKYAATPGTYVYSEVLRALLNRSLFDPNTKVNTQKTLLDEATPQCAVCGIGAAFCSLARLGNKVEYGQDEHDSLEPYFDKDQLALIEYAFEGSNTSPYDDEILSLEEMEAAEQFFYKHEDANKRLAAIFRNIIRNDGTFKP